MRSGRSSFHCPAHRYTTPPLRITLYHAPRGLPHHRAPLFCRTGRDFPCRPRNARCAHATQPTTPSPPTHTMRAAHRYYARTGRRSRSRTWLPGTFLSLVSDSCARVPARIPALAPFRTGLPTGKKASHLGHTSSSSWTPYCHLQVHLLPFQYTSMPHTFTVAVAGRDTSTTGCGRWGGIHLSLPTRHAG